MNRAEVKDEAGSRRGVNVKCSNRVCVLGK